ncbi:HAD-like protein [Daldinia caldariorum]|uniref:HAD-like protein n=1 Tax=Daldinia caldariorum TaxID=326644 RepID=UPI002008A1B8|nr:HAD-like protein [Daldinia caldariorum]KAI1468779.1 HAD-like protein [Daldinia caldariorum]
MSHMREGEEKSLSLVTIPTTQPGTRKRRIKAVFFDFMGTCLDWHSGVSSALPAGIAEATRSRLALDWREEFFGELHARSLLGLPPEDIDITHRKTLLRILGWDVYEGERRHFVGLDDNNNTTDSNNTGSGNGASASPDVAALAPGPGPGPPDAGTGAVERAVRAWHNIAPWSDVRPALTALKSEHEPEHEPGLELFVLANGTTRLQLDLVRSSGLEGIFSLLFSSELLGVYKPAPEAYEKALGLVRVRPDEAVMVAAHAYDLRAARALGMSTVYVHRWTDDRSEDMDAVRRENDAFLEDGMEGLHSVVKALSSDLTV